MAGARGRERTSVSRVFLEQLLESRDHFLRALEEALLAVRSLIEPMILLAERGVETGSDTRRVDVYLALSGLIDGVLRRLSNLPRNTQVSMRDGVLGQIHLFIHNEIERLERAAQDPDMKPVVDAVRQLQRLILGPGEGRGGRKRTRLTRRHRPERVPVE